MGKEKIKDAKYWVSFMLEVLPYIKDENDKEIVKKRLTKKMEMFFKIMRYEINEIKKSSKINIKKT